MQDIFTMIAIFNDGWFRRYKYLIPALNRWDCGNYDYQRRFYWITSMRMSVGLVNNYIQD